MAVFTPVNQVRLTNVAVVRLKKGGKRFELACYPNKVIDWRDGIETDLDEVLQTDVVFTNVSKGSVAKDKDLHRVFKTEDKNVILETILTKGQVQVSGKERAKVRSSVLSEIIEIIATKCVNPETQRPYPSGIIERAVKDLNFSVHPKHSAKKQALELIPQLAEVLPIERASMRLRITTPAKVGKAVKSRIEDQVSTLTVEDEDWGSVFEMVALVDPGAYRAIDSIVGSLARGQGRVEILDTTVIEDGEEALE
ncbi:ribosome maturation protein SBDS [Thecamonas trahens ATCC 50062]|uniref:Ribosome maturation protein SBDS n=1 Tax=Thecamonas trahens ATCC 50062 TaxID=461836 RepID=A0A0L0DN09_THETB|nr:ribosome maturation protein SBDS [Thecamonas trahens ATCC 50062]KNC53692.1 ribosome maturation protein SBDS [Thecamonas trahens ATCC 50062]|eukprot:XP_013762006.1 ribosome maturation protein SBDS [Thecamonas trahens ATCC 50062]